MSKAIIFDLKYTPYTLPKNATQEDRIAHEEARAFYDLTGGKNVLKYITTEGKRTGKKTALEYLQKSTGVFNQKGMIQKSELDKMKERVKDNKGHIWHGFISLSEKDSPKIDSPEKCINLVKRTINSFFVDSGFNPKNMDLICALHLDKTHHLHIHFVFWEKEKRHYHENGYKAYRAKGNVCKKAIDNMFVRIGNFLNDDKKTVYEKRVEALKELRERVSFENFNKNSEEILKEVILLSKDLPKSGRLSYGSKDMEQFKGRVDKIVNMLIASNGKALKADRKFYAEVEKKKQFVKEFCKQPQIYGKSKFEKKSEIDSQYRYDINEKNIKLVDDIVSDYKRRQGNLVLGLCKIIKPEIYERKEGKQYKANDNRLKRNLSMSSKKIHSLWNKFLSSFFNDSELLERDFSHRLKDIEEELKREREKKNKEGIEKG